MNIDKILQNKELAYHEKRNHIAKSDYSNVLYDTAQKALNNSLSKIEVLIYETEISRKRNEFMFNQYLNGYVLNHSVSMRYIKLFLCVNSDEPQNSQEKESWDKYYAMVLNKDLADMYGYFWAVVEAKNIEGSAVVKGSNFLTPVLSMEIIDEDTIRVKLAISPSNIIDSHMDCHMQGIWKKTLNENNYDLLLQEHDMDFDKVISDSVNDKLKVYTEMVSVKELLSKFNNKENKNIEAVEDTSKNEPTPVTQKVRRRIV